MTRTVIACLFSQSLVLAVGQLSADDHAFAARIDMRLAQRWSDANVSPVPQASDAEFLRRAWLDLCGIIPPLNHQDGISGVYDFLASKAPNKRELLVKSLLAKPRHGAHFANIWKNVLLPNDDNARRFGEAGFQSWLRAQFVDNVSYDRIVSQLILASGNSNQVGPALYYSALQVKPEALASSTSRVFLGTQINCAQCHDHPFDHWKRADFWSYAAFFAQLAKPQGQQQFVAQVMDTGTGEVTIPDTDDPVPPKFLSGNASPDGSEGTRRQRLATWITSKDNPYFARAAVNRIWAIMFGRGIVEPVDDLGQHNPASHPELLQELSEYFVETGFDVNRLIRTLAMTRAYQLSSRSQSDDERPPELFARMAIKSLTAEQLYDCLIEGMRKRENAPANQGMVGRSFDQRRTAFLAKFRAPTQGATEFESGIPQALTMMNGVMVRDATDLKNSDLLGSLEAPFISDTQAVRTLFLSTLSRLPDADEQALFGEHVELGKSNGKRQQALGDILWAILNSAEFVLNH